MENLLQPNRVYFNRSFGVLTRVVEITEQRVVLLRGSRRLDSALRDVPAEQEQMFLVMQREEVVRTFKENSMLVFHNQPGKHKEIFEQHEETWRVAQSIWTAAIKQTRKAHEVAVAKGFEIDHRYRSNPLYWFKSYYGTLLPEMFAQQQQQG